MAARGYVYFIESGFGGLIKIGYAQDPESRMVRLQTGNPEELHLLAVIQAPSWTERELHDKFKAENITGEWFAPSVRLWNYLEKYWCYDESHGRREHEIVGGYVETKVIG
jgi:hypothetical protein